MAEEIKGEYHPEVVYLKRCADELKTIRMMLSDVVNYMRNAEGEVPEKMRRFVTYMHDVHDIVYMYESRGISVPRHVFQEMERCDDRYRQLLKDANTEGGAFEKIRREMAADPLNRWDHTRELPKPEKGQ